MNHLKVWALLLLLCFGCGGRNKDNQKKQIAIVVSTLNNPWFVFLAESAAEKAQALGYTAKIFDSQNNTALETDHFENAIAAGFDAILFNPTDAEGSVVNATKAMEASIPVFCMDREINSRSAATSQILSDSYAACVQLGELFANDLERRGNYAEILGIVSDNNTWNRSKGFHSVVDNFPNLKMVAQQSADFDRNKAMEVMESILQGHPDIKGVFCGNDAMAMGAYQATVAAGKQDQIKIYGFDGAEDAVHAVADGRIQATAMQFPKVIAEKAAKFADAYFKGERTFRKKLPIAVDVVTQENINQYIAYGKKTK
ncbi:D-ribose ABC transporter substrate-binding protein [Olivibacter jilunii]|uniref:D-ribose ABC transporter substrate-binding protein n=1 Tax=Olivibacter jilunii TaxID=985016 RepID=UPI00102F31A0|nr:D-ribose ABC transporter substrate-binding protein [Olivibacter jilunii]